MKRIVFLYPSLICILLSLMISCSNDDDQSFISPESKLTESVKTDFYSKYQNRIIKDVYVDDNKFIIDFVNTNNTEKGSILYVDNVWNMALVDYKELSQLPEKVINSFNSRYSSISDLDITKVDIEGLEQEYYSISFVKDTLNFTNLQYEVLINLDGDFLQLRHEKSNKLYCSSDLHVDTAINYLSSKYKNAKICTFQNQGGRYVYNILDGGIIKFVRFRNDNLDGNELFWEETRFDINISDVPSYVIEELELREPLFDKSDLFRIEYLESNDGNYFIVWCGNIFQGTGYHVKQR